MFRGEPFAEDPYTTALSIDMAYFTSALKRNIIQDIPSSKQRLALAGFTGS